MSRDDVKLARNAFGSNAEASAISVIDADGNNQERERKPVKRSRFTQRQFHWWTLYQKPCTPTLRPGREKNAYTRAASDQKRLTKVKKAEPRELGLFEYGCVEIAALEDNQLFRCHFPAIRF